MGKDPFSMKHHEKYTTPEVKELLKTKNGKDFNKKFRQLKPKLDRRWKRLTETQQMVNAMVLDEHRFDLDIQPRLYKCGQQHKDNKKSRYACMVKHSK